jgi:branched-chain amino acid transport system substrate-binding protein
VARNRPQLRLLAVAVCVSLMSACGASDRVREEVATRSAAPLGAVPSAATAGPAGPSAASAASAGATSAGGSAGDAGGSLGPVDGDEVSDAAAPVGDVAETPASAGSGGGGSPAAAAPVEGNGGATDVGVSETSIKIGATFFNGGFLDKYSQVSQQAAQAYFNFVNDQGGVYGRRIDYLPCDTAGQAQGTAGCLNKFIESDKVFAIGPSLDFNLDIVQPTLEENGVPWVGSSGLYPEEFASPFMFPTQLKGADVGAMMLTFAARDLGAKTVGVSWVTIGAGPGCLARVKELAPALGVSVVAEAVNEDVNNGLTSQVQKMSEAEPDAVLFCNDPVNTVKFVQTAGSKGYEPPKGFVGGFVAADDVPEAMGRAGIGLYGFSSFDFYKSDSPDVQQFRQVVEFYYPRTFHHFYTQAAYTGAVALVEGLKAAGPELTRQRFLEAIRGLTVTSMGQTIDFSNLNGGRPSGVMLRADENLRWRQHTDRFEAAG